jgi:ABC-type multidrug transport system fused ATPase/permease subunit
VLCLQDVFLFHGSIFENLTLGDESITLENIKKAHEIEVDEFIERLPGYDYVVSERGSSISLGKDNYYHF